MKICPLRKGFIKPLDASNNIKNLEYVAAILGNYIEKVGPKNIVQICADNTLVMKKTTKILIRKCPHLYFQGYVVHVLNLLLDVEKNVKWVKEVVNDVKEIVKFIKD